MFNASPTHFHSFLNETAKVLDDSSTLVLWDVLHSINDSSFQLLYVPKIITTESVFQNPHKWKSRGLKSGLFAPHGWRVLRLMHLVSKWFEIHFSISLDTCRVTTKCFPYREWPKFRLYLPGIAKFRVSLPGIESLPGIRPGLWLTDHTFPLFGYETSANLLSVSEFR